MKRIYADFAAATPTDRKVAKVILPFFAETFGNPSSLHSFGQTASQAVGQARQKVAEFINAKTEEIYFTGSGTESNNLAILGLAKANRRSGNHIVTSQIEHPSIINACRALEKDDWQVTYLPVDKDGLIDPSDLTKAITKNTVLVSIHLANSEIGVIQPIKKLAKIAHQKNVLFHTDACQAANWIALDVKELGVDLLSFNGSKIYGPKGIAVLYVQENVTIFPIIYGGGQERSLRSGSENVPGIIGLAAAIRQVSDNRESDSQRIGELRNRLQVELTKNPKIVINISGSPRLPNHLSVQVGNQPNRDLVRQLDNLGIAVSAGSACSSRSLVESHVLMAIGLTTEQANSTIRISLGRPTTEHDIAAIGTAIGNLFKANQPMINYEINYPLQS